MNKSTCMWSWISSILGRFRRIQHVPVANDAQTLVVYKLYFNKEIPEIFQTISLIAKESLSLALERTKNSLADIKSAFRKGAYPPLQMFSGFLWFPRAEYSKLFVIIRISCLKNTWLLANQLISPLISIVSYDKYSRSL